MNAYITTCLDDTGELVLIKCTCGHEKREFWACEFDCPQKMVETGRQWLAEQGATEVSQRTESLGPGGQIAEALVQLQALHELIQAIADEIEAVDADSWDAIDDDVADSSLLSPDRRLHIFRKIKSAFAPQDLLALARTPDSDEWKGSGPLNPGLVTIKNAIFSNTPAEWIQAFSLKQEPFVPLEPAAEQQPCPNRMFEGAGEIFDATDDPQEFVHVDACPCGSLAKELLQVGDQEFVGYRLGWVEIVDHTGRKCRLQAYFDVDESAMIIADETGDIEEYFDQIHFLCRFGSALTFFLVWEVEGASDVPQIREWFAAYERWGCCK